MIEYLTLTFVFLIALLVGGYIGKVISDLKKKAETGKLQEKINQLELQITEYKLQQNNSLQNYKESLSEVKREAAEQINKVEEELEKIRKEKDFFSNELAKKDAEFKNLQQKNLEQKKEVENLQEKFIKDFENLANRILEQKSEKFTNLNKENLQNILNPLNEKIKSFEEKVNKNNNDFIDRHAQLTEHLKNLNQQSVKISEEANNLTRALKGESKTQGNWGELILEKVLEKSGLERDREFFIQRSFTDEAGKKLVPDVIIHLPNNRKMVIDSKVSLVAYERYCNEEEEDCRAGHLKDHIKSLHNHILQLSSKKYEDIYKTESPDFVLMFIPVEPALYLAQNSDNSFFYSAFQKNILLVSPTTLLSTLRTIDTLWSNEKQQRNAVEIANHAASLYHKFKILLDELDTVGSRLKSTSSAYDSAMKKLTGQQNLIKDIGKLEELGISPKQKINQYWLSQAEAGDEEQSTLN